MLFKLLVNRYVLSYTLWRKGVPTRLRSELVTLYEDKIDEMLDMKKALSMTRVFLSRERL